jgi:PhzF family phenazine biosynthesis protein
MKGYAYKKIDAFTSGNSLGNPAACIYLAADEKLTAEEMLCVARQHRGFVSEMVYFKKNAFGGMLYFYSSECEVDFCGHGTIACMADLVKSDSVYSDRKKIEIETHKKGNITIYNEIERENAVFITAPEASDIGTDLLADEIAEALGLSKNEVLGQYPVDMINAGLNTLIVPVADLQSEIQAFPDEQALKAFCLTNGIDIVLIYSLEVAHKASKAHTRVFAPKFGYLEDPATGSGNSAFGHYMQKYGLWDGSGIAIEQGGCDRVFNTVRLKMAEGRILFGGNATVRIEGTYYI